MVDHWLVRTSTNVISGPYARDELIALIRAQRVGMQDEICVSDGSWFGLHENAEIQAQLGVRPDELNLATRRDRLRSDTDQADDDREVTKVVHAPSPSLPVTPPVTDGGSGGDAGNDYEATRAIAAQAAAPGAYSGANSDEIGAHTIGRHEIGHPGTLPSQTDGDTVVARKLGRKPPAASSSVSWVIKEKIWRWVTTGLMFVGFFVLFVILKKLRSP